MTRDAAVQQARERVERLRESLHATYNGGHHEEPAYSAFHQGMDTVCNVLGNGGALDAYALDRLAQELGELAKEMCGYCAQGMPLHPTRFDVHCAIDGERWCTAFEIRRRLASIGQVRKEQL